MQLGEKFRKFGSPSGLLKAKWNNSFRNLKKFWCYKRLKEAQEGERNQSQFPFFERYDRKTRVDRNALAVCQLKQQEKLTHLSYIDFECFHCNIKIYPNCQVFLGNIKFLCFEVIPSYPSQFFAAEIFFSRNLTFTQLFFHERHLVIALVIFGYLKWAVKK